jgi:hypothetical protein
MTNYVIESAQQVSLPVRGSDACFSGAPDLLYWP